LFIKSLEINNLRNIRSAQLVPGTGLNLFVGDNGAGKTTILESLVMLAKGRSFRSGNPRSLIGTDSEHFRIVASLLGERNREHRLGLERGTGEWRGRIDGKDVRQLSDFSVYLPLIIMEPNSHALVSGAPELRRRFMDWGVFHVKHEFLEHWRAFTRALRQRNAALRIGDRALLASVDAPFVRHGQKIDEMRRQEIGQLIERLQMLLKRLSPDLVPVEATYRPGWSGDSLAESLAAKIDLDLERGSTGQGPHRADLQLRCDRVLARERLSRGEQKILAAALIIAQGQMMAESGAQPVLLLDDLASEFDAGHLEAVIDLGRELGAQCWVTGVNLNPYVFTNSMEHRVFHVKHGQVSMV
jgi:DNA replication and repair protein RecF